MKKQLIFALVILSSTLSAQSFSVELSSDSILLGSYFEIKFSIENSEAEFEAPEFENMQIVAGPNYSSSMQMINNVTSSKKSISYLLKPTEIGNFFIPPAYLIGEDNTMETEALSINVFPNPEGIIENTTLENNFGFQSFEWNLSNPDLDPQKKQKQKSKSKQKIRKI